ncbi:MAG: type IV pili twitching motility protein PilT [Parcubacteria group bacterium CG1_02_39_15]|uniref:Type IV pili twitching motility protein PilT n=3 Tax=Candidatus Nealsoniibacteriota TaxID=1817911 RepID=A0A2H0MR48_9BACT|nr:MAG: type IV pili twitching motility protein PilT [Parcubacteria group bacterium CG1_02_39_15]PIQ98255.1 MAG: type IV pili twitching motility protein PilT [Candidatus Nealsonbacteria bacterium CG11_big_fil_rev_8_21_14_0_20_39_9]PIW90293.1 MAG: type IV pili twitching motility protein PilT [Candidatus Nealsonbacteria bacterium CG_4_8_14_3_um_filter_40_11]PIZ88169.1 MAG: type IV pili twitching motility protein PilT [Candidatus Nealsonbacteria bacterium CG_4_10_14_0_2_um_filter_39_15]
MNNYQKQLKDLLTITCQEQASDLHLCVDHPPIIRLTGRLIPLVKQKKLSSEDLKNLSGALMQDDQKARFLAQKEVDFSYNFIEKEARFRVNIFFQSGEISCALRLIPAKIRTIDELNLPPVLHEFTTPSQGFVLMTGPSSHGKSTTLAALIDEINHNRTDHIITIEDPIEYVFRDDRAIIDQREVYQDTLSFARALRSTFRQDPDVIMVGEMRDPETMGTAITAAETGHLVFATLHTNSASQTIHRIVDSFPSAQQDQIRAQLSGSLLGVVSQRLVPRIRGGLIPACEVMMASPAVANLIRENKIHELPLVIETSAEKGMISLNRALADLVKRKEISLENALTYSLNPVELKMLIR